MDRNQCCLRPQNPLGYWNRLQKLNQNSYISPAANYSIKLSLRGEPLLHPEIDTMVSYAREKGIIDIYFNTNAVLLDENTIHRLLDAGLFRISISVEGTTGEVYEKHRVGARFDDVVRNVKNLKNIRDKRKLSFPQIRVQTVLLDELKGSFPAYVEFWKGIADEVSYLDARKETPGDNRDKKVALWACPFLWQRIAVLWDGTALPCLMHGVKDPGPMSLGNAGEKSIGDMWMSARSEGLRISHKEGESHKIASCVECSYRAMETDKLCTK